MAQTSPLTGALEGADNEFDFRGWRLGRLVRGGDAVAHSGDGVEFRAGRLRPTERAVQVADVGGLFAGRVYADVSRASVVSHAAGRREALHRALLRRRPAGSERRSGVSGEERRGRAQRPVPYPASETASHRQIEALQ